MANGVTLDFKMAGLQSLLVAIRQLPVEMQGPVLRRALHSGAKVIKDAAKATPAFKDDTGFLRTAIVQYSVKKSEHQYTEQVRVGVRKRRTRKPSKAYRSGMRARARRESKYVATPYYWRYLEFGTSGMQARPFMRPAFEANKFQAVVRIRAQLKELLDKATTKLASQQRAKVAA